ncbi:hypothetical protein [Thioalkalivibrio denitrificans]|uniref:hypothetical protein n=1 Tax=Thioalkalivibrio denitrificans TaxID=108003 RepID=UPI003CCBF151
MGIVVTEGNGQDEQDYSGLTGWFIDSELALDGNTLRKVDQQARIEPGSSQVVHQLSLMAAGHRLYGLEFTQSLQKFDATRFQATRFKYSGNATES